MATTNTNYVTKVEMEEYISKLLEMRLLQTTEKDVARNVMQVKEFSLLERIVRVEEELKSLRKISEINFQANEKRFESLLREMNARFEAIDKRFEAIDSRFESLQREMNARFEAMDKRFSVIQWMIGILVGIPAIAITLIQVIGALK